MGLLRLHYAAAKRCRAPLIQPVECHFMSPNWLFQRRRVVTRQPRTCAPNAMASRSSRQTWATSTPSLFTSNVHGALASICANMSNTMLDAMSVDLPIPCADRGPMPDVLDDGCMYSVSENADAALIVSSIKSLVGDADQRASVAQHAKSCSAAHSWTRFTWTGFEFVVRRHGTARAAC